MKKNRQIKNTPEELRELIRTNGNGRGNGSNGNGTSAASIVQQEESLPVPIVPELQSEENIFRDVAPALEIIHEQKLVFRSRINNYHVLGSLSQDIGSMAVTLLVEDPSSSRRERDKVDLYEHKEVQELSVRLADIFHQRAEAVEAELIVLTDLLERHRDKLVEEALQQSQPVSPKIHYIPLPHIEQKSCVEFLSQPNLIQNIDELLSKAGIAGEENNRKLLFTVASTYKMQRPLHALVECTEINTARHLISIVSDCFPPEDVLTISRITGKSLYNYRNNELVNKLIIIRDYDGLQNEARIAFRELQCAGIIHSSTTYKDKYGNIAGHIKTVKAHFSSIASCKEVKTGDDAVIFLSLNENAEQTEKIITYQNKKTAGLIDEQQEQRAKYFLQNCIRLLKPHEVINKYADRIRIPAGSELNSCYHAIVKQVTLLHQFNRSKDEQGRLITEIQDLQTACDILFDSIVFLSEDLDPSLRNFFTGMKQYVKKQAGENYKQHKFTQLEIRQALKISKTQCFRYMRELKKLEYIRAVEGTANKGFKFQVTIWDEAEETRTQIKAKVVQQIHQLGNVQ